jgi:hypothetical protein
MEPEILALFIPCTLIKIFIHNANECNDTTRQTENTSYRDRVPKGSKINNMFVYTEKLQHSNLQFIEKYHYSRTPLIRINQDGEPSGYAEIPDNWILLSK